MAANKQREWVYKALAIIEFATGFGTFLSTWLVYGFPILESIAIGMGIVVLIFVAIEIASNFTLHSKFLAPLRKRLLYALSCVVIDKWSVILDISDEGNALTTNEFFGKVNFGCAQWLVFGIWAGQDQAKKKDFEVRIFDVLRQNYQNPEFLFNESRMKTMKIRFSSILKRGERFHFRIKYELKKTFYFDKEDYYDFQSVHHEKELKMKVVFPENVKIEYVREEVITEHGDVWEEHEKAKITDPQTIEWHVQEALFGNHHTLYWKATKKSP
jgi:hypothetical protein